jgi:hypothetical protein
MKQKTQTRILIVLCILLFVITGALGYVNWKQQQEIASIKTDIQRLTAVSEGISKDETTITDAINILHSRLEKLEKGAP